MTEMCPAGLQEARVPAGSWGVRGQQPANTSGLLSLPTPSLGCMLARLLAALGPNAGHVLRGLCLPTGSHRTGEQGSRRRGSPRQATLQGFAGALGSAAP